MLSIFNGLPSLQIAHSFLSITMLAVADSTPSITLLHPVCLHNAFGLKSYFCFWNKSKSLYDNLSVEWARELFLLELIHLSNSFSWLCWFARFFINLRRSKFLNVIAASIDRNVKGLDGVHQGKKNSSESGCGAIKWVKILDFDLIGWRINMEFLKSVLDGELLGMEIIKGALL